jgi:molecular chaperone DnaK
MADAEKYAEEDRQRREEAEVRNQAETLAYTTEKFLGENADKVPDDIKSEVESSIADLKKALEGTDTEAIRTASEKAAQVSQKMGSAIYAQAQAANAPGPDAGTQAGADAPADGPADEEVVDAEIVDEGKPADEEGGAA